MTTPTIGWLFLLLLVALCCGLERGSDRGETK